jgi:sugar phosphate isomerase/epimerase
MLNKKAMKPNAHDPARRRMLKAGAAVPFLFPQILFADTRTRSVSGRIDPTRFKVSLNAFSFNAPLTSGEMTIGDVLAFCASAGLSALDITAYYFPGYPNVPSDELLYDVKRKAFSLGVEISGTGVRNDFTEPDPEKRRISVQLVKAWIEAAEKLGAPVIRIFSGTQQPTGVSRARILAWMIKDIEECVAYGKAHGVVVAVQNHNDFIKTADDAIEIMTAIPSPWFGLILDTGSYRSGDPYEEIRKSIGYAVNWQIKEKIFVGGREVEVDTDRLITIIEASTYRGYLPLETLGEGDPKIKIPILAEKVKKSLGQA